MYQQLIVSQFKISMISLPISYTVVKFTCMIWLFSIFFFHLAFSDLYCILILYAIQMFEIIIYEKKMHSKITVSSNKNEIKMNHVTNVLKIYPFDTAMTTHKTHNTDFTIRYVLICVKSAWQIITYI